MILASASPARRTTLEAAGLRPEVIVSGVDESAYSELDPAELVATLACAKARAVAGMLAVTRDEMEPTDRGDVLVIGCDSLLELDGQALGKPAGEADAVARWQRMSGRSGVLVTGHCLITVVHGRVGDPADDDRVGNSLDSQMDDLSGGRQLSAVASTIVHFAELTNEEIAAYVGTGEPLKVAGAFTLDGLGGAFVEGIEGDPHNVVGISLPLLRTMLAKLDIAWIDLWHP